jgi:hypothetical protein
MRERRPSDWRIDLDERHPLERGLKRALEVHPSFVLLEVCTAATHRLDFQVRGPGERLVEIELKAKRQPYQGWAKIRPDVPEPELFILDELAFRRLIDSGRYGVLLVRDRPRDRWFAWTVGDLLVVSKMRANRRLAVAGNPIKAKLLIDLREAPILDKTVNGVLDQIASTISTIDARWIDIAPWSTAARTNGEVA